VKIPSAKEVILNNNGRNEKINVVEEESCGIKYKSWLKEVEVSLKNGKFCGVC
jgi:hypothetical protein